MSEFCKNCNYEVKLDYCPSCGQSAKIKRIDGHYIKHEVAHLLHFEKGIFYTIKELLLRPGKSVQTYLTENRSKLLKPFTFIVVTSLIYTLVNNYFHFEDNYINPDQKKLLDSSLHITKWVQENYGYANILMGVFIAAFIKIFFRRYNYNFYEIIILICFTMGFGMLIYALLGMIEGLIKVRLMQISLFLGFIYTTWAIGQFFEKGKVVSYIKAFLAYLFGALTFMVMVTIIDVFIALVQNNKI